MTQEQIDNNFIYHSPKNGQEKYYQLLRDKLKEAAVMINEMCPESREKSIAFTHLETAMMWANASIARNE